MSLSHWVIAMAIRTSVPTSRDLRKKISDPKSDTSIHGDVVNICPEGDWGGPGGRSFESWVLRIWRQHRPMYTYERYIYLIRSFDMTYFMSDIWAIFTPGS